MITQKIDNRLNGYLKERAEFAGLSPSLQKKLEKWDESKRDIERPNWVSYFLGHAFLASTRSVDARTQHGCVLVDSFTNTIISEGYNGFIRDIDDRILPNYDSEKYPFILHSEINCLLNCARQGRTTLNSTLYITGLPCLNCLQSLYQAGVTKIFYGNKYSNMLDNQDYKDSLELFKYLIQGKMTIMHVDFDEEKLEELIKC